MKDKYDPARRRKKRKRMKRLLVLAFAVLILTLVAGTVLLLQKVGGRIWGSFDYLEASGNVSQEQVDKLKENREALPERLLTALEHNEELLEFAVNYLDKTGTYAENISLEIDESRSIPLFLQWDQQWGYARYGDGCIGLDGCGPTCLSMVLVGLTGDETLHPKRIADFSMQNGFVSDSSSTSWSLMTTGAESLGLTAKEVPLSERNMAEELQAGHPIICSVREGDFTTTGHFIVLYGYQDGSFLVNDPNSRQRSRQSFSYDRIAPQIKAMWAYSVS